MLETVFKYINLFSCSKKPPIYRGFFCLNGGKWAVQSNIVVLLGISMALMFVGINTISQLIYSEE